MDAPYRILVVDDNPINVLILRKALQKQGYEVLTAEDGFKAVELTTAEQPDIVLLDMMMPERDGLEVCRILKSQKETAGIPVIFVTAVSETDYVVKAFAVGGSDYVAKPFKMAEVLARVSVHARVRRAELTLVRKNRQMEKLAKELADVNVRLSCASRTDPLTNLLNRRAWEESAVREHERLRRHGNPYSVLIIDVDQFKAFNDSQGHQAGDDCLRCVSGAIVAACRRLDVVGRYGGEEFVVLSPEAGVEAAVKLAERIRRAVWDLAVPHAASSVAQRVTVSIGVAVGGGNSWEDAVKRADQAMYVAKRAGRNMVYADSRSEPVPQPPAPLEAALQPSGEAAAPSLAQPLVLVVDDDPADQALYCDCLESQDYRVQSAYDGGEALVRVSEQRPDIILMDWAMTGIDGLECTRRLRANFDTRDIPIIMIGARTDSEAVAASLEAGADEYLIKPVATSELILRVRSMARLHRERADLLVSYAIRGEQTRILQCLLDFSRAVAFARDLDEILEQTLAAAAEVTGGRRVSIMLADAERKNLVIAKSIGADRDPPRDGQVSEGQSIPWRVFASQCPMVLNDAVAEPPEEGGRCDAFLGDAPLLCTPLGTSAKTIGVLTVADRVSKSKFEPRDLEYIDLIANIAGSAINRTLNRQARDQAREAIMVALAKLAEHRDNDTGRHVDRVTRYCLIIGEELRKKPEFAAQIDEAFIRDLERAAPLHDIGKVAIPDQILLKPGRLTAQEMDIMRSHADIGAETIQLIVDRTPGASFLKVAAQIARAHHEWYDGSGYPRGLRGAAIPLAARIAALADVYDAITTRRSYKQALTHEKAVQIIVGLSGTQFDPEVVQAFLKRQEEFVSLAASAGSGRGPSHQHNESTGAQTPPDPKAGEPVIIMADP